MVTECCQCANVANTNVASCQFCHHLAIGIGNWQHFHIGNISAGRPCRCRRGRRACAPPRRPCSFVFRSSCASWSAALDSTTMAREGQMRGRGRRNRRRRAAKGNPSRPRGTRPNRAGKRELRPRRRWLRPPSCGAGSAAAAAGGARGLVRRQCAEDGVDEDGRAALLRREDVGDAVHRELGPCVGNVGR